MRSLTGNYRGPGKEGYVDRQEVVDARYYLFDTNRVLFQKKAQLAGKEKWMKFDFDPVDRAQKLREMARILNLGKEKTCDEIVDLVQRIQVEDFNGTENSEEAGFTKVSLEEIEKVQKDMLELLNLLKKVPQIYDPRQVTYYTFPRE